MKKLMLSIFSILFALSLTFGLGNAVAVNASDGETTTDYLEVSVTLTEDITFNFIVSGATGYEKARIDFAYLDGKTASEEVILSNGGGTISFDKLPPQYMSEKLTVTLALVNSDGTEDVQPAKEVSLRSYARTVLDKTSANDAQGRALRKLVTDMLYYGDAAQNYVFGDSVAAADKATAVLTDAEKNSYALNEKAEESDYSLSDNASSDMRWVRYGAKFDSRLGVFFEFIAKEEENLSVRYDDGTVQSSFETRKETVNGKEITVYKSIKYLSVLNFGKKITARLYAGDKAIGSPITYSVNSLTFDFASDTKEYALAIAAATYASSAVDYKNGVGYYYFEAEDERTALTDSKSSSVGKLKRQSTFVGNLSGNTGAVIEYFVKAGKATTATLSVVVTKADGKKFTDTMTVKINDTEVASDAIVPARESGTAYWSVYTTVELGDINLAGGDNVISFVIKGWSAQYNFDKIILKCADSLEWGADSHECSEVCEVCGYCMNEYCGRYACKTKCTCEELKIEAEDYTAINNPLPEDGSKGTFGATSGFGASGGKFIKDAGNIMAFKSYCTGDAYLEYTIYSDEDAEVSFSFGAGVGGATQKSSFDVKVTYADDTSVDFTAADGTFAKGGNSELSGYYDWQKINYGKLNLKKGKNVVRITVVSWASMNIDYFTFKTANGANLRTSA